ncbi:DUF2199 domain-containing protein [Dongia sp.]|uniref:DUF2199 domain-containing protein n=1 Tax=Dongia sp. TaxID=1977262 RepID=UPI0037520682
MDYSWTCACCGKQYNTLPLDFAIKAPHNWFGIPDEEAARRVKLTQDVCIIDGEERYIRGCLEIPVTELNDKFIYGVWASVSERSFNRIHELWDAEIRDDEPPLFGWLCSNLPLYGGTLHLKTNLHLRNRGQRPFIELEPTDHPLAVEQRNGITVERVQEIIAALSHRH